VKLKSQKLDGGTILTLTVLADRTDGRAYATVLRLSAGCYICTTIRYDTIR